MAGKKGGIPCGAGNGSSNSIMHIRYLSAYYLCNKSSSHIFLKVELEVISFELCNFQKNIPENVCFSLTKNFFFDKIFIVG